MKEINYSIIIPHYNIPELLVRCLKSIPVREDIQVIVVDDCSPNASTYLEKYPELSRPYLEYYSTPKGGSAGRARNIGLDHAKGKWVICMDADDLFVDNMEEILEESLNRDEDVLYYNYKSVMSDDLSVPASRSYYNTFFEESKIKDIEYKFRYYFDPMWGKIFRNENIQKYHLRCDETRYGNDAGFSYRCGALARKIAIIDKPFFIITERAGSLASSEYNGGRKGPEELKIRIQGFLNVTTFNKQHNLKVKYYSHAREANKFLEYWPVEFFKYFFSYIVPRYPKQSLIIAMYILYTRLFHKSRVKR